MDGRAQILTDPGGSWNWQAHVVRELTARGVPPEDIQAALDIIGRHKETEREENNMNQTYAFPAAGIVPVCRYCGQVVQDAGDHLPFQTQAEAEEWAARHCGCAQAKSYKLDCEAEERRRDRLQKARDRLEEILSAQIEAQGINADTVEHLFGVVTSVYDEYLAAVTVKVDDLNRLAIRKDSNGNIELSYKETHTQKYHI